MPDFSMIFSVFTSRFQECKTTTLAASVAFYTALSLAPLLIIFLALSPLIDGSLKETFVLEVHSLVGPAGAEAMRMVFDNAESRLDLMSISGILGAATLALSASLVFGEMRFAFNTILEKEPEPETEESLLHMAWDFVKSRVFHLGLALGFIFIMVVSLLVTTGIAMVLKFEHSLLGDFTIVANILISFSLYVGVFVLLFHFLPKRHLPWKHALFAAVLTSILFVIGKELVGIYLGNSTLSSAYGAAGSLIVLLAWVYYSALIIFIGAHVSYAFLETSNVKGLDSRNRKSA